MNLTPAPATRAKALTALLSQAPHSGNHKAMGEFLSAACDLHLKLLFIKPGTKVPADTRTTQEKAAADRIAQDHARESGRSDWQTVTSRSGVYLATDDCELCSTYLKRYTTCYGATVAINLAVAVGPSRLVVVDCDTRQQVQAFLADAGMSPDTSPTVRSPGAQNNQGDWVHSDGGHFWFTVPDELDLPAGSSYTDPAGGYAVMWGMKYILIPPSVRPEGPYTVAGEVHVLADWLRERIVERASGQREITDRRTVSANIPITEWDLSVPWSEVLVPLGWKPCKRSDDCGCPTWTAPGIHASPKSGTAHVPGCSRYDSDNPPFHIWTDAPGEPFQRFVDRDERRTFSKLQVMALANFNGNVGDAMEALGLTTDPVTFLSKRSQPSLNLPDALGRSPGVVEIGAA